MNRTFWAGLIVAFALLPILSFSQSLRQPCGTVERDQQLRAQYPSLGTLEQFEDWLAPLVARKQAQEMVANTSEGVLIIPTVVHIIHQGEALGSGTNISNAQVLSQIRVLNDGFRKKFGTSGWSPDPRAGDTQIEFAMAQRDPAGQATDGIMRYSASSLGATPPFSQTSMDGTLKPATIWNPNEYFNIWVSDLTGGLLGYAQFPTQSGLLGFTCLGWSGAQGLSTTDGIAMDYSAFGSNEYGTFSGLNPSYQNGKVALHETGHWLGLRHIWGDASCGSDYVEDTPVHDSPSSSCGTHPVSNSCGTADEMFENHMDYGSDACKNIFTYGQGIRMRTILTTAERRRQLIYSPGAVAPTANDATLQALVQPIADTCAGTFVPSIRVRNTGTAPLSSLQAGYRIDGGAWQNTTLAPNLAYRDSAVFALAALTAIAGEHTIQAYISRPNGSTAPGQAVDTLSGYFRIGGRAATAIESFEGMQFPPRYWRVSAPFRACYKWLVADAPAGPLGVRSQTAGFRTFTDNGTGQNVSSLVTELYSLPAAVACTLSFDYACSISSPGTGNQFSIEISRDCGATWDPTPLASYSGTSLYTTSAATGSDFWAPTLANQWKRVNIPLTGVNERTIRFRFKGSLSGAGGLYVDNIMVRLATDPSPVITALVPDSGIVGTQVRVRGRGLGTTLSAEFSGTVARVVSISDTTVVTEVPVGAATGPVTLRAVAGIATSPGNFWVLASPTIRSFWPAGGNAGTLVTVKGRYLSRLQSVQFNGTNATFSVLNDSTFTATVPAGATTGLIQANTRVGSALSPQAFIISDASFALMENDTLTTCNTFLYDPGGNDNYDNNLDIITTLVPGIPGKKILLTLQEFQTATTGDALRIYDGPNVGSTLLSTLSNNPVLPVQIISSAVGGQLTLRFTTNSASVAKGFKAQISCISLAPPQITSFTPSYGRANTTVTILGRGFVSVRQVLFGGFPAAFNVVDTGRIVASVPTNAVTAPIIVTSSGGADTTDTPFIILDVPSYCTPTTVGPCGIASISRVTLSPAGLRNTISCTSTNYRTFLPTDSLTGTIRGGTTYTLQVTSPVAGWAGAWFDFNRSGSFSSSEFFNTTVRTSPGQPATLTISVPSGFSLGSIGMRVAFGTSIINSFTSCQIPAGGEVQDYILQYVPTSQPIITQLNPISGPIGTPVTIRGYNLDSCRQVRFANNVQASFTGISGTEVRTTVPTGAVSGFVSLTNPNGTGTSPLRFIVGDVHVMTQGSDSLCSGLYTDPGGDGEYSDNLFITQTLYPATQGKVLRMDFNTFLTEGCCDYLYVYDGPNTSYPLIGTYFGSLPAFSIISSHSSGCLTLVFRTDGSVTESGWEADVSCVNPVPLEITDFYPKFGPTGSSIWANGLMLNRVASVRMGGQTANFLYSASSQLLNVSVPSISAPSPIMAYNASGLGDTTDTPFFPFSRSYCVASSSSACSLAVKRVWAPGTGFRNSSGCGQATRAASQFPPVADSLQFSLRAGVSQTLNLTLSSSGYAGVFVDYDQDGQLETNEFVRVNTAPAQNLTTTLAVPFNARLGLTLMRIVTNTSSPLTSGSTCSGGFSAEMEDYLVRIMPADSQYILAFTPMRGGVGTLVRLQGKGFARATAVRFGGVAATSFAIQNDSNMTATVPSGAVTGPIQLQIPTRTVTSYSPFTVIDGSAAKVLILHSDNWQNIHQLKDRLYRYPQIARVDTFDARLSTPILDSLLQYDAILVLNVGGWNSRTQLGDVLTQALQRGVGVVQSIYTTGGSTGSDPGGSWSAHQLIPFGPSIGGGSLGLGNRLIANHELLQGVRTFRGGSDSRRTSTSAVNANTLRVADWSDGRPLVVARDGTSLLARRVDLGFYPVSNALSTFGYEDTTQGDLLVKNALFWASGFIDRHHIQWFSPDTAAVGQSVTVSGRFGNLTGLKLNNTSLVYTVVDTTQIRFTVPSGATSGFLYATGSNWSDTSRQRLVIAPLVQFTSTPVTRGLKNVLYSYDVRASHPWNKPFYFTLDRAPSWLRISGEMSQGIAVGSAVGSGSSGTTDGPVTTATLARPMFMAQAPDGRVVFADQSGQKIRIFQPGGSVSTIAGSGLTGYQNGPASTALFNSPTGVAYDTLGNLYVTDMDNHCIRKITPTGTVSTFAGTNTSGYVNGPATTARFNRPSGIVYHKGFLYVSEINNGTIRRIDMSGNTSTYAGTGNSGFRDGAASQAMFDDPGALIFGKNDELFVADEVNNRVRGISTGGIVRTVTGTGARSFADGPLATALLANPQSLAIDPSGNLIVGEWGNYRVRYVNFRTGQVSTLAGSISGYNNGSPLSAQFNGITGLLLQGNRLYISDSYNRRLRSLDLQATLGGITGIPPADGIYPVMITAHCQYGNSSQEYDLIVSSCRVLPPVATVDTVCAGQPALLSVTGGTRYNWYTSLTGTIPAFSGTQITVPYAQPVVLYYVSSVGDSCESERVPVAPAYDPSPAANFRQQQGRLSYLHLSGNPVPVTYQWLLNGSPIAGATDSVYTATVNGNYALITGIRSCVDTSSAQFVVAISGKPALEAPSLVLVPNPATGHVIITLSGPWAPNTGAALVDATGRTVRSFSLTPGTNTLSLEGMAVGAYHLKLATGQVHKLMVE